MSGIVLVVDPHPVLREGLRGLLEAEAGLSLCGGATSTDEALGLIEVHQPDLVISELEIGRGRSYDWVREVTHRWPQVRVLIFSKLSEDRYAERALRAGASGYIMKDQPPSAVLQAVRAVLAGAVYVSDGVAACALKRFQDTHTAAIRKLSARQLQVFHMIGGGMTRRQIAETLNLSVKTVEAHVAQIRTKLGLGNRRELMRQAIEGVLFPEQLPRAPPGVS